MAIVIRALSGNQIPGGDMVSYSCLDGNGAAFTLSIDSTQTNCDVVDVRGIRYLAIKPSASVTQVSFYACDTSTGTFVLVDNIGTNGVVSITASKWTTFDWTKIAPLRFIQMKSDQAGATAVVVGKS